MRIRVEQTAEEGLQAGSAEVGVLPGDPVEDNPRHGLGRLLGIGGHPQPAEERAATAAVAKEAVRVIANAVECE